MMGLTQADRAGGAMDRKKVGLRSMRRIVSVEALLEARKLQQAGHPPKDLGNCSALTQGPNV